MNKNKQLLCDLDFGVEAPINLLFVSSEILRMYTYLASVYFPYVRNMLSLLC